MSSGSCAGWPPIRSCPRRPGLALAAGGLPAASPSTLIADVIPVLGYADDALVVVLALRSVTHRAGADALVRHWPGTSAGLRTIQRLASLTTDH
ncbi:MAG: YkvA family protein [Pseudonocardiaceae bacterium]